MGEVVGYALGVVLSFLLVLVVVVVLRLAITFSRRKKVHLAPIVIHLDLGVGETLALMERGGWHPDGRSADGGLILARGPLKVIVSQTAGGVVVAFLGLLCDAGEAHHLQASIDALARLNGADRSSHWPY